MVQMCSPADSPLIMYSGKMVRFVLFTIQQNRLLYIAFAKESLVSTHSPIPHNGVQDDSRGPFDLLTISSSSPAIFSMLSKKAISESLS